MEEAAGQIALTSGQHQQLRILLGTKLAEAFEDIGFGQQVGPSGGNLHASRAQGFFQRCQAHGGGLVKSHEVEPRGADPSQSRLPPHGAPESALKSMGTDKVCIADG